MVISEEYDALIIYLTPYNTREKGDEECFWNYTPPEEIWCSDEEFLKMKFEKGLMFGASFNLMTFKFYKILT